MDGRSKQTGDEMHLPKECTIRGVYQKRIIAIRREIKNFEIAEQRLVQARVIRTNEWLTEVE